MDFVPAFVEAERREPAAAEAKKSDTLEYRLNQRMRAAAVAWARSIGRALGSPGSSSHGCGTSGPTSRRFPLADPPGVAATYGPVMLLAVFALKTIHLGWPYVLCWLPAVYFSLYTLFLSVRSVIASRRCWR